MGASERGEFLRAAWRALVAGRIDGRRLVFVDEMGSNTSLFPLYAWAPRGKRALVKAPPNWEANVSLLASMSAEETEPYLALEGSTREVFEVYWSTSWRPSRGRVRS